jgi:TP901 family phage tail tape measure protein
LAAQFAVDLLFGLQGDGRLREATQKVQGLSGASVAAQASIDKLTNSLQKQGTNNAQLAAQLRRLKGEYDALSQAAKASAAAGGAGFDRDTVSRLRGLSTEIGRTREALNNGKTASAGFKTEIERLKGATNGAGRGLKDLGDGAKGATASVAGLGAAIRSVLGPLSLLVGGFAVSKIAADFGDLDTKIRRLGTAGGDSAAIGAQLVQIEKDLGGVTNQAELAASAYQSLSAGFSKTADIGAIITASAKAAVGGLANQEEVTSVLVKTLNAYGLEASKAAEVTDIISKAVEVGNVEWSDYVSQLGKVSGMAAASGVSFEELNAFIAASTKGGATAEQAFTGLSGVLTGLMQPTKESQEAAELLGVQWNLTGLNAKGLEGLLKDLNKAQAKNPELAARMVGGAESVRGAFAAAGQDGKLYAESLGAVDKAAGKTDADFRIMAKSFANQAKAVDTAFRNLGKELALAFGPQILDGLKDFKALLEGFAGFVKGLPGPVKSAAVELVKLATAVLGVHLALKAVIALRAGYAAAMLSIAGTTAATGGAAAVAAPKLTALAGALYGTAAAGALVAAAPWIAAAAGVIALGKAVYDTNETFRNFVDNVGGVIANDFRFAVDGMATDAGESANAIQIAYEDLKKKLDPLGDSIRKMFKSVFKDTSDAATDSATTSTNAFGGFFSSLQSGFAGLGSTIAEWWKGLPAPVRAHFEGNSLALAIGTATYGQSVGSRASAPKAKSVGMHGPFLPGSSELAAASGRLKPKGANGVGTNPELTDQFKADSGGGSATDKAQQAADKLAEDQLANARALAENQIEFDQQVYDNKRALEQQIHDFRLKLQQTETSNWVNSFTGAAREQAGLVASYSGKRLEGLQAIKALEDKIADGEQRLIGLRQQESIAAMQPATATGGAAGGEYISKEVLRKWLYSQGMGRTRGDFTNKGHKTPNHMLNAMDMGFTDSKYDSNYVQKTKEMEGRLRATRAFGNQLFGPTSDPKGHKDHLHIPTPGGMVRNTPGLQSLMGGTAAPAAGGAAASGDMSGQLSAAGGVAAQTLALQGLNEQLKLAKEQQKQMAAPELTEFVLASTEAFRSQSAELGKQTEAMTLRNRLEMEGVNPAVIEGELQKLAVSQQLAEKLDVLTQAKDKGTITAEAYAEAVDKVRAAANGAAGAIDKMTGAAVAQADPVTQLIKKWKTELNDTRGMVASLAGTVQSELGSAMSNAITGVIQGTTTIKEAFSQMFSNIGKAFIDMATQMIAKALIMKALGILGGAAGGGIGASNNYSGAFGSAPSTSFGDALKMPSFFADGGYVTGPTNAVIGENGENEYVIPASKMGAAMQRYSTGSRGSSVIAGSGDGSSGGSTEGGGPLMVNYTGPTLNFNGDDYLPKSAVPEIISVAAKQGAAAGRQQTFSDLRNKRSTRARLGMA